MKKSKKNKKAKKENHKKLKESEKKEKEETKKKKEPKKELTKEKVAKKPVKAKKVKNQKPKTLKKKKAKISKRDMERYPTLKIKNESEIAMDFATKAYKKFDKIIKSVILFGSSIKQTSVAGSDIDIIIVIDDASIKWDSKLIAWYRDELAKILKSNPYQKDLHVNSIKLTTWWEDLIRGDPVIINILRYGESMLDLAGFFEPLKNLLINGKIDSTPEAIYNCLQRAPVHFARSKASELNSIEGLYWAMVDSAHAALIAANIPPTSPEHIPRDLKETFVNQKKLKMKYVIWYRDLLFLHKKIAHGEINDLKGIEIDDWQEKTEEFIAVMAQLVKDLIEG